MLNSFGSWIHRLSTKSASTRSVLKLAGGTAGSQMITLAAAPILTRLYGPESFGVLATFTSLLALLNVVSSLRFELAIPVPKDDDEAISITWTSLFLVVTIAVLTGFILPHALRFFSLNLNEKLDNIFFALLALGVLSSGLYKVLSYWSIRTEKFNLLAKTKIKQGVLGIVVNVAFSPFGSIGLLLGQITGQSAGILSLWQGSSNILNFSSSRYLISAKQVVKKYFEYALYGAPAGILNVLGNQVPYLMLITYFGASQLGFLSLAERIYILPAALIGGSVQQVLLSKAPRLFRARILSKVIWRMGSSLFCYGFSVALIYLFVIRPLIPHLLGTEWTGTARLIPLMTPMFLAQIVVSPLSPAFVAINKTKLEMICQFALSVIRILSIVIGLAFKFKFETLVLFYYASTSLGYALYAVAMVQSIHKSEQN